MQNLVVEEVSSMILLRADYASFVIESASSKMIILKSGHLKDLSDTNETKKSKKKTNYLLSEFQINKSIIYLLWAIVFLSIFIKSFD